VKLSSKNSKNYVSSQINQEQLLENETTEFNNEMKCIWKLTEELKQSYHVLNRIEKNQINQMVKKLVHISVINCVSKIIFEINEFDYEDNDGCLYRDQWFFWFQQIFEWRDKLFKLDLKEKSGVLHMMQLLLTSNGKMKENLLKQRLLHVKENFNQIYNCDKVENEVYNDLLSYYQTEEMKKQLMSEEEFQNSEKKFKQAIFELLKQQNESITELKTQNIQLKSKFDNTQDDFSNQLLNLRYNVKNNRNLTSHAIQKQKKQFRNDVKILSLSMIILLAFSIFLMYLFYNTCVYNSPSTVRYRSFPQQSYSSKVVYHIPQYNYKKCKNVESFSFVIPEYLNQNCDHKKLRKRNPKHHNDKIRRKEKKKWDRELALKRKGFLLGNLLSR
jgi:hypothetical protein